MDIHDPMGHPPKPSAAPAEDRCISLAKAIGLLETIRDRSKASGDCFEELCATDAIATLAEARVQVERLEETLTARTTSRNQVLSELDTLKAAHFERCEHIVMLRKTNDRLAAELAAMTKERDHFRTEYQKLADWHKR
jgi:hypothetical protein